MINHQIGIGVQIAIDHQIKVPRETEIQIDQAQTGIIKGMIHPEDRIEAIEEDQIGEDRTETTEEEEDRTEMIEHHQIGVKTQIREAEHWKDRVQIEILTGKMTVRENPEAVHQTVTAVIREAL